MKALLQRVTTARVTVGERCVGAIGSGLLVFLGLEQGDQRETGVRLLQRILDYRIFADADGRMNRSVTDGGGEGLLGSQASPPPWRRPRPRRSTRGCWPSCVRVMPAWLPVSLVPICR